MEVDTWFGMILGNVTTVWATIVKKISQVKQNSMLGLPGSDVAQHNTGKIYILASLCKWNWC